MILAADVSYRGNQAYAVGALFESWTACQPSSILRAHLAHAAPYIPGQFYRREMPCILALLQQLDQLPEVIVIDGYVVLGSTGRPGLGQHLYNALQGQAVVIGVAKSRFRRTPAVEVLRPGSRRPLYVTAAGIDATTAAGCISAMCGGHRLPDILRLVDRLCRDMGAAG
jgi:deoxyribonuclease V